MLVGEKWFKGMTDDEITAEMSRIAWNCTACAVQGEKLESEKSFNEFESKFNDVIPAIVDIKTAFYMYKTTNPVYDKWEKCMNDLHEIRRSMRNQLWNMNL